MFGFLKEKLANFGSKLKETISGKQKEKTPEEVKTPEASSTPPVTPSPAEATPAPETSATQVTSPQENSTLPKEASITTQEPAPQSPIPLTTSPTTKTPVPESKEVKSKEPVLHSHTKKTKEEAAADLEKKLFEDISKELEEEEEKEHITKITQPPQTPTPPVPTHPSPPKHAPQKKGLFGLHKPLTKAQTIEEIKEIEEQLDEDVDDDALLADEKKSTPLSKPLPPSPTETPLTPTIQDQKIADKRKELFTTPIKKVDEDKRELKSSIGIGGKLKGFLFGGVEISEKDITDLLFELELSLIESDVEQDAAKELVTQIRKRLLGQKVSLKNIDEYLKDQIKDILTEMMTTEKIDLLALVKNKKKENKPLVILVLGPNGAGKTTSIAKLTHYFKENNYSVILAAGDTFRAAAIDQLEVHATALGVRMIKQQYGADPAAVAFDAVKAAEAAQLNVVIIDSAGRQETNKNLMEELHKLKRVAKPDVTLYVGEAYAGQGLLDQAKEFADRIGIDGFILTKIDADAKGGTTISLLYKIKKPVLFLGTGQGYDDFREFTPEFILDRIV